MDNKTVNQHASHSKEASLQWKSRVAKLILATTFIALLISICIVPAMAAEGQITWEETDSLPDTPGEYYLTCDVTLSSTWETPSGNIIIDLKGHNITMNGSARVINVVKEANLTVTDTLTLADPSATEGKITGGNAVDGAGVYIAGGKFTLACGNITNNTADYGGGVYVNDGGSFIMSGGNIAGNTASQYDGGVAVQNGTFIMSGGNITNNTASQYDGGGVYVTDVSSFTMSGGNIAGNTAKQYGGGGVCLRHIHLVWRC